MSIDQGAQSAIHHRPAHKFHRAAPRPTEKRPVHGPWLFHFAFIVQYGPGPNAIPNRVTELASMFWR